MKLELLKDESGKMSATRVTLMTLLSLFCYLAISGSTVDPVVWTTINSVMLIALGGASVRSTVKCIGEKR